MSHDNLLQMASEPIEMANEERQMKDATEKSNANLKQKEVRFDYEGAEEMIKDVMKSISLTKTVCERELSSVLRLGDPRREKIMSTVTEQLDAVEEKIHTLIFERLIGSNEVVRKLVDLDEDVREILEAAQLTDASRLESYFDKTIEQQSILRALCKLRHCEEYELETDIQELTSKQKHLEDKLEEAEANSRELSLQIECLTEQVKAMGRVRNPHVMIDSQGTEDDTDFESSDGSERKSIARVCAGLDPEELMAFAQARLRQTGRTNRSIGHRPKGRQVDCPKETFQRRQEPTQANPKRCFDCGKVGHMAKDCKNHSCQVERTHESNSKECGSFSAALESWLCVTEAREIRKRDEFFGKKLTIPVKVLGVSTYALLDTGSETSIAPLKLFARARERGIDVDTFVERVPQKAEVVIRDASGNRMNILDAIRMEMEIFDTKTIVPMYVSKSPNDMIIIGTNVLHNIGLQLTRKGSKINLLKWEENELEHTHGEARTNSRIYVPSGGVRTVTLSLGKEATTCMLWSNSEIIGDGICEPNSNGEVEIPVTNTSPEAVVLPKNHVIGEFEKVEWLDNKATADANDNSALSIFHKCPEAQQGSGGNAGCSIRGMVFGDVVKEADETIAKLPITTIYSLARYISIYEQERDADRRNFLMRDKNHEFVTTTGVQKAYVFFKRHCLHTLSALIRHDGSALMMRHDGESKMPIDVLNELVNEGVRYAAAHSWDDVVIGKKEEKTLLLLPPGFRYHKHVVRFPESVTPFVYENLPEICRRLREVAEPIGIVLVGPTTNEIAPSGDWMKLTMALTHLARGGSKLVALAPPRGEKEWEATRMKMIEMMNTIRESSYATRSKIVTKIPSVPSVSEPCLAVGMKPRKLETAGYPNAVVWDFINTMQEYVKGDLKMPTIEKVEKQKVWKEEFRQRRPEQTYIAPYRYPRGGRGGRGGRRGGRGQFY
ncbi:unnamed protein product [Nippostrongylus brasiliensis]|uniref:CCHC-type domain-containing protein n=1 Tax=Nippostrongylus brasiliensis TaxID=27835 RepID=A0A0N4YBC6_NIPBR|nr:unnamed protein product [Nippostrongylus brasiliensis]